MTTIFASDFHGTGDMYINKIQRMIKKYPAAHIVFGGDYIDGRPDSKQVINYIWQMQRKHHAVALKGNHEDMLDAFLKDDDAIITVGVKTVAIRPLNHYLDVRSVIMLLIECFVIIGFMIVTIFNFG